MSVHDTVLLVVGVVAIVIAFMLLKNYETVKERYPVLGWVSYLFLIVIAFKCYAAMTIVANL